ncbi:uncharacterized protein P884DRAFT_302042 [Thermothelomyces heterothallicus CBS 202.75]|uniref:uncharacterized protein n=1 Tax=Thermothelomyces heterothallicus CBS 202.75 TaxID=1149848 RepID=UPI003742CC7E
MRTQLELRSATRDGGGQAASERDSVLRSPARRLGPRKSPTRPIPRPLPPPAPEEDDELLKAISARLHPGVPPGVLPEVADPEPELPPTPQHPDPVVSTPPSGIHNTPSRRPKRNRALAERLKSSSPLKPSPIRRLGKSANGALPFSLPAKNAQAGTAALTEPAPPPAESRGLKPADPDAEKKRLRDSLLAEISRLERDLDIASRENERIRQARLSRREPPPPANGDEILDLLARHVLPPGTSAPKPDPIEDLVASALNPIAFLPFSKPSPSGPPTLRRTQAPRRTQAGEDGGAGGELPPPVSHHPLPMTATEALPYLQVFTPLTFTAHVSPLPRAESGSGNGTADAPLLQQHSITASSASPRGLFAARIEMTVNTKTMAVASLAVPRLDPAAEAELRPFINKVVGAGENENGGSGGANLPPRSSGLYNNVSVLTWAMGEWLRVAVQRAKAWIVLEREVGGSKEAFGEMVRRMRAGQMAGQRNQRRRMRRRRRRRRWVERGGEEGEEEEEEDEEADQDEGREGEDEEGESVDGTTKKYGTADLLPFMGRTCIDLEVPVLEGRGRGETSMVRVQWRIGFDWTGEAQSEIGVLVGLPAKWHKHDERGQLSDLPKLFDELIQEGEDPLNAVRTVVCLLAGEQRAT